MTSLLLYAELYAIPVLLGLSSLFCCSFLGSSFSVCWGLRLIRNLFSGMGGISSGRTVEETISSSSFSSSAWIASDFAFFCFFLFFFCFLAFFFFFLDSFSDSSVSEESELSDSLELLLDPDEACFFFLSSFFAFDLGTSSPQFNTFTSAYGLLLGSVFWFSMV